MARHLGELEWEEVSTLQDKLIEWLKEHGVAGSVAEYSLYSAIQREWEFARAVCPNRTEPILADGYQGLLDDIKEGFRAKPDLAWERLKAIAKTPRMRTALWMWTSCNIGEPSEECPIDGLPSLGDIAPDDSMIFH